MQVTQRNLANTQKENHVNTNVITKQETLILNLTYTISV